MKTIKNKLLTSLLTMIIIIPVIMIIIFNLSINMYFTSNTKKQLKTTVKSIEEGLKNDFYKKETEEIDSIIKDLQLSNSIDFIIFDDNLNKVYPENIEGEDDDKVTNELKKILPSSNKGNVQSIKILNKEYYVMVYKVKNKIKNKEYYFTFIAKENYIQSSIREINYILLSTMVFGILINILIANSLSKAITKPIKELSSTAKLIGDGKFSKIEINNNIEEIVDLYNSINLMSTRLKANSEYQNKFLQNASHEMRTPLMSIQGYAEGIESGILDNTNEASKIIKEESIRLNNIVTGLLNLSKIETGLYTGQIKEIYLTKEFEKYVEKLKGYALSKKKEIILYNPQEEIIIKSNEKLLAEIFINVISNCIKYATNKVCININSLENFVKIKINDDGKGISQGDLPHILERFYKGNEGNFGLGLSIAKAAAESLEGSIEVYNDNGANFVIKIPILNKIN